MSTSGHSFNWTSGFDTYRFTAANPNCSSSFGLGSTIPPSTSYNLDGLIPGAIIPDASIVANITNFTGDISIDIEPCGGSRPTNLQSDSLPWKPVLGKLTIVKGQCVVITFQGDPDTCSSNSNTLEVETALIGDFCARSPTADVCKDHDPKVTVPPSMRASEGEDTPVATSNSTGSANTTTTAPSNGSASASANTPSAEPKSGGANHHSAHRMVMVSLAVCVAVVMASF